MPVQTSTASGHLKAKAQRWHDARLAIKIWDGMALVAARRRRDGVMEAVARDFHNRRLLYKMLRRWTEVSHARMSHARTEVRVARTHGFLKLTHGTEAESRHPRTPGTRPHGLAGGVARSCRAGRPLAARWGPARWLAPGRPRLVLI